MPDPSPGQVCYEAFDAAFPADRFVRLQWAEQAPAVQAAWETAAQAVLARWGPPPTVLDLYEAMGEEPRG